MTTYCPDKKFGVKTYIAPCHLQTWLLNIVNGFETKTLVVFGSFTIWYGNLYNNLEQQSKGHIPANVFTCKNYHFHFVKQTETLVWTLPQTLATDHIFMQPQALSKTMVTKAINTLSNVFRLKVDKSITFQFPILPLYDEYIYIQNHKVLKR